MEGGSGFPTPTSVWTDSSVGDDAAWRAFPPSGFFAEGDDIAFVSAAIVFDDELVVTGGFVAVDQVAAPGFAAWNGTRFDPQDMDRIQPVVSGLLGPIRLVH